MSLAGMVTALIVVCSTCVAYATDSVFLSVAVASGFFALWIIITEKP